MKTLVPEVEIDNKFVLLMAVMTSLMALSIDMVLPALESIRLDLGVVDANKGQLIISSLFLGFGFGQFFFGALSDSFGRKRPIFLGAIIYIIGCLVSVFSKDLNTMLLGRVLQGFGVASFRIISIAVIRDKYSGIGMAKIMSLVMTLFIMVPVLAPSIGQLVLLFAPWQSIFVIYLSMAIFVILWFGFKQEETLPQQKRKNLSLITILSGAKETLTHPVSGSMTVISGFVFGGLIAYISSTQQIFQDIYKVGKLFPIYFGSIALMVGISSFINSKLVSRFGIVNLVWFALIAMVLQSVSFLAYLSFFKINVPHLALLMLFFAGFFFNIGLLFGNLNSLALHSLGHIAGVASSVIGSVQNFIAVGIGALIASQFSDNLQPIIVGFTGLSILSFCVFFILKKKGIYDEVARSTGHH